MARIVDFNINNAKHIPSTSSSCNIVINNTKTSEPQAAQTPQIVNPPEYPQRLVYPPPLDNPLLDIVRAELQTVRLAIHVKTSNCFRP